MIPVEYFWGIWFLTLAVVGAARGLARELGTSAIMMLTVFSLYLVWEEVLGRFFPGTMGKGAYAHNATIVAIYYAVFTLSVAFIAYEGFVVQFPVKEMKGAVKAIFGFMGGILNGYLVVGTVWDVVAQSRYFFPSISTVAPPFSLLHETVTAYLPITLMTNTNPFVFLIPGMILLLAIILT